MGFRDLMSRYFQRQGSNSIFNCPLYRPANPDLTFHAKLYVFATRFLITPLRLYSLKNLCYDLSNYALEPETASAIMELLLYVYNNTTAGDEPGGKSFLREMTMAYVACKARDPNIKELLKESVTDNQEIVSDLLERVLRK